MSPEDSQPGGGKTRTETREHVLSGQCWCRPTLECVHDDGTQVWVHHPPAVVEFTHNGWMMFCPIKIAMRPDFDQPVIASRWSVLEPLLSLAQLVQSTVIWLCWLTIPGYEPRWYFKLTSERRASQKETSHG